MQQLLSLLLEDRGLFSAFLRHLTLRDLRALARLSNSAYFSRNARCRLIDIEVEERFERWIRQQIVDFLYPSPTDEELLGGVFSPYS